MSWLPGPPGSSAPAPAPYVVLADRAGSSEFAALRHTLSRLGVPSVRVDAGGVAALALSVSVGDGTVTVDGHPIAPTVVWARHLSPRAAPGAADPAAGMLRADSWRALIGQLGALAPSVLPGGAPGRLEQLAGAARAGIRIPRTVVTTDPGPAAAAMPGPDVVVKVLDEHFVETAPGLLVGVFPEVVPRAEAARWAPLDFPVIVQEHVRHDAELRVFHLAGAVYAYAVVKSAPDALWRDATAVAVTPVPVPPRAAEVVRGLAELWGLIYGAFDLLLDGEEVVFLEVNVDGDWRWFESKAGDRAVSHAAARMVRALHLRAAGDVISPPPVGIVDFLTLGTPSGRQGR
ncbi:ATP-grasp domain-containing protein [Sphaerisporangium aureirubrum]|uniref:RimK family alpha-L-glutamate ligase n=1 Tax=Sphaerisporangium aureirubrum TaxID=1544736 RepID=A0ABW1NQV7_9ACTN